jgi:hypothetical protein
VPSFGSPIASFLGSVDWLTLRQAIQRWVSAVALTYSVPAESVFWAFKGKPRPPAPYIEMGVTRERGLSHDWLTKEWNPLALAPQTLGTITVSSSSIPITAHTFLTGDGPVRLTTTGTLPAPLALATDYWVIKVDADHIALSATFAGTGGKQPEGASNPTSPIILTTVGTGTHTIACTSDSLRAGQELIKSSNGLREVVIRLECFVPEGQGTLAVQILGDVIASIPLYNSELDGAGLGMNDLGQAYSQNAVQLVEGSRGSVLEARALVDLTVYVTSRLSAYETIVETIDPITLPVPEV